MRRLPVCFVLWVVFGGIFLASLPQRFAHLDDAWLGEQAYWLLEDGVVRSELFHGFLGYDERIFVFHKLFIPQGALAIHWLGWSQASLKLVSLAWFVVTLSLLAWAVRRAAGASAARWALLLYVAHPLVVDYAYTFRPELCLSAFGLATYLVLAGRPEVGVPRAVLAGALAGLGFLVHMNGIVFVAGGAALLAVERESRALLAFGVTALAVAACYGLDAWLAGGGGVLAAQFRQDPALDERDFSVLGTLRKLALEPTRWYRHGEDVAWTGVVLLHAGILGRALWREHRRLVSYVVAAALTLGLVAQSKTPKYAVPLFPVLALLLAAGVAHSPRSKPGLRVACRVAVALFLAVGASRSWRYFQRNGDEPGRHARIVRTLEPGSTVVADLTFVFDELEHYRLRGLWAYRVAAEARGEELDLARLAEAAREDGVQAMALDLRHSLPRRIASEWRGGAEESGLREVPCDEPDALVLAIEEAGS